MEEEGNISVDPLGIFLKVYNFVSEAFVDKVLEIAFLKTIEELLQFTVNPIQVNSEIYYNEYEQEQDSIFAPSKRLEEERKSNIILHQQEFKFTLNKVF